MSGIDWDKAPEGTTHLLPEQPDLGWVACWYKQVDGIWFARNEYDCAWHADNAYCETFIPLLVERPVSKVADDLIDRGWLESPGLHFQRVGRVKRVPQWSGEGLPPVGTVCEMTGCKSDPEPIDYDKYKNHIGKNVSIVAHHDVGLPAAVYAYEISDGEFEYYSMIAGCFRPIRTPEQIAAEERDAAIFELTNRLIANRGQSNEMQIAEALYDAGYRKQATK